MIIMYHLNVLLSSIYLHYKQLKNLGFLTQATSQIKGFIESAKATSTALDFSQMGASLSQFSASTVAAAASMAGLTAEQTASTMAAAGFTASETAAAMAAAGFDAAAIAAGLSANGLAAGEIAATMAASGFEATAIAAALATTGLGEAEIIAALEATGLSTAEAAAAVAAAGFGAAATGATGATLGFAAALKAAATGLATFLLTNPVGWAILAAGAIFGIVKVVDALTESFDEACDKADDARQTLKNAEADVRAIEQSQSSLKTQVEDLAGKYNVEFTDEDTIQDIIDKLKELNLSTADAQTLSSLETQTQQLEAQLQIKQKIAEYDRMEAGKAAQNVLGKNIGEWLNEFDEYGNQKYWTGNIVEQTTRKQQELNAVEQEYNQLLQDHANTQMETSKWWQGATQWEQEESRLAGLESQREQLTGEIADNLGIISENYDSLLNVDGTPLPGMEDTVAQVDALYGNVIKADEANEQLAESESEAAAAVESYTSSVAGIAEEASAAVSSINAITDAMNSQATGKSVSLETYNSDELRDYSSALEYHNGVLQYNAEKVREITKAKAEEEKATIAANKAQDQAHYLENAKKIQQLRDSLTNASEAEKGAIQDNIDSLLAENAALVDACTQYDLMTASINEATSAYQNWLNAQNSSQSGDMFDSARSAFDFISDTLGNSSSDKYMRTGNADYKAAVEFVIPDSVDRKDTAAIQSYMDSIKSYFTFDDNGSYKGLNIGEFCNKALEAGLMEIDESGESYQIAGQKTMQDFADGLGLSLPLVQAMFGEMEEFDIQFDWADEAGQTLGDLAMKANESAEALRNMEGNSDLKLVLDVSDFSDKQTAINTLDENIRQMNELKAKPGVDASEIEQANSIIQYCVAQKQILNEPAIMTVDASQVSGEVGDAIALLQEFQSALDTQEMQAAVGADTSEADAAVASLASEIEGLSPEVKASLNIDTTSADTIAASLQALSPEILVKAGVDSSLVDEFASAEHDSTGMVTWDNNTGAVDSYAATQKQATGVVVWGNNTANVQTHFTASGTINWSGGHKLNGTAHAAGTARAGGDWGTAPGGTTLVGELGQEIVVDPRTGKWYTVGDTGAEFVDIPHGAIVFNHLQSASLLANGYAVGRASAMANGTAMVTGKVPISLINTLGGTVNSGATATSNYSSASSHSSYSSAGSSNSTANSSSSKASDDFEKEFDWVEVALNRIEEAINRVKIKAESAYKTLAHKNAAAADEIELVTKSIDLQNQAYKKYIQEANALGLSADWVKKIQDGSIELSKITDEDLADKIQEYQDLYEKAIKAKDAIAELKEQIADLYLDKFNNIVEDYENQLSLIEHMTKTYEEGINQLEEAGMLGATAYYQYLMDEETKSVKVMQNELATLEKALEQAMQSGEIEMYSDAWYEMMEDINGVRENIDEATTSLLKYQKAMRELKWDYFDFTEDNISNIITETEFLIDLLSNKKLFDDNGQMTDEGQAVMGLHGENYNVYMAQADDYAEEIKKLNAEIANDPTNTDLLKRRQELVELQQKAILNAGKEKEAIVDLVSDGYDKQLSALKDIINAYTDSLDSAKDLYDYQKKVKKQTQDIAVLQKQLAAYSNDTSEETQAKVQKLQVDLSEAMEDLEETQYERYIADQKKLLDDLYSEYETVLNNRIDDVDALIGECIGTINAESGNISDTITREAANVGYSISEANKAIWANDGEANSIITKYGENFKGQLTSINSAINGIKAYTDILLAKANAEAAAKKAAEEAARRKAEEASKPKTPAPAPQQPAKQDDSSTKFNEDVKRGIAAAIWIYGGAKSGWGNDPERKQKLTAKFGATNAAAVQSYINAHANNGDLYNYWISTGKNNLSKYYYSAFKTGAKRITKAQDAWTQEAGRELILSPSRNAMLTSMEPGDSVLTSQMTDNIWRLAKNPEQFIGTHGIVNVGGMFDGSAHSIGSNGVSMGDINITIPIDHIEDYDDFVEKLKNDGKFEKMIQAMTVGRLAGGSKLEKQKYQWK